jgi:general secretion pathway protein M
MKRIAFNRIVFLQVLTVLLLLVPLAGASYVVWVKHHRLLGIVADLEPRYARLQGLLDRQVSVKAMDAKAKELILQLAYPATQDLTKTGNDAQQRIRGIFADSQLDVISTQVLPGKIEGKFDRISISLRVEGNMAGIQAALGKLGAQSPAILVDNMNLQTLGMARPASVQKTGGQFVFSVFRVRP